MALSSASQGRSAREWSVRAVVTAGLAVISFYAMSHTIADMLRTKDLEKAHALAPSDARISAQLSTDQLLRDNSPQGQAIAKRLAQLALRHDPTTVAAVSTLGLEAQLNGNTRSARRAFAYSEMLSRRNLATQLWAIEDAVGRKDIPGALRHYDIALRTSRASADLLFPVLSSAIGNPEIRNSLIYTLASKPSWAIGFISHLATSSTDPRAAALLFEGMRRKVIEVPTAARTSLTNTLIAQGHMGSAWDFYKTTHPGSDRRHARDPRFSENISTPSLFDWVPSEDGGISASIQRSPSGAGVFDFAAPASVGGTVLQQLQVLLPGQYQLQGHSIGIDQPVDSQPYWALSCHDDRELGRISVPNSSQDSGFFSGRLSVPSDCPVQTLSLIVRSSDMQSGVAGQISQLRLGPAS